MNTFTHLIISNCNTSTTLKYMMSQVMMNFVNWSRQEHGWLSTILQNGCRFSLTDKCINQNGNLFETYNA